MLLFAFAEKHLRYAFDEEQLSTSNKVHETCYEIFQRT